MRVHKFFNCAPSLMDRQSQINTDSNDTFCPSFPIGKHVSIKRGLQPPLEVVLAQQHSDCLTMISTMMCF